MINYFVKRPIAIVLLFVVLLLLGLKSVNKVPVSLLPSIDVPQIIVRVDYPNSQAIVIEETLLKPIRNGLLTTKSLKEIESKATSHTGLIYLNFHYGAKMDLTSYEVNEKIDRVYNTLPRDFIRPQVVRLNTSDIPVLRLQIIPKNDSEFAEVSQFVENTISKRISQLDGVSFVDINGLEKTGIYVTPNFEFLQQLSINESFISQAIQSANHELQSLSVGDGQYQYFIKVKNDLSTINDIRDLNVFLPNGESFKLNQLAKIEYSTISKEGVHLYNGKRAIVVTIQKAQSSRMNELVPKLYEVVGNFRKEYNNIDFTFTQDQSSVLKSGIDNLKQDLIFGGLLTVLLLFLFLGNWSLSFLMCISIPCSLIISFFLFYIFKISFNIISLSGLALGIGMLIDNSIVVLDSINRMRMKGYDARKSSILGTTEVIVPVISQVLTTVAVYAPLVILTGITGPLVFEQSIALTISLTVSLVVAFVLIPVLYVLSTKKQTLKSNDTILYELILKGYHKMIIHILKFKIFYLIITLTVMFSGYFFYKMLPVKSLPTIVNSESLILIDWNKPINLEENELRCNKIYNGIKKYVHHVEVESGIKQFLLQHENNSIQQSEIYIKYRTPKLKDSTDNFIRKYLNTTYPEAEIKVIDAPNAFTQLFVSSNPFLELKFSDKSNIDRRYSVAKINQLLNELPDKSYRSGLGLRFENGVELVIDYEKMFVYGVSRTNLEQKLKSLFSTITISDIKSSGSIVPVKFGDDIKDIEDKLRTYVFNDKGIGYPINYFVNTSFAIEPRFITSNGNGQYYSVLYPFSQNVNSIINEGSRIAKKYGYTMKAEGTYFQSQKQIDELFWIFILVVIGLYLILAIQYENFIMPLLVMLTIPIGVSAGLFLLWVTGSSIDVMAAVGFIVVLGLIVDDPILKIETLNRLSKKYFQRGKQLDNVLLEQMIHEAGDLCLKPLLMVSLTTSIALVPVLFVSGLGNDLQKPMAIVIIGGLTIGTFFTTWFIPISYFYFKKIFNK